MTQERTEKHHCCCFVRVHRLLVPAHGASNQILTLRILILEIITVEATSSSQQRVTILLLKIFAR